MVLPAPEQFIKEIDPEHLRKVNYPASINVRWVDMILVGGVGIVDASPITDPVTQITDPTRQPRRQADHGTLLLLQHGWDPAFTNTTAELVVVMFGRTLENVRQPLDGDQWHLIPNADNKLTATLTVDLTNDVTDPLRGLRFTKIDLVKHTWDIQGCDQVLVGIDTAYAGDDGDVTKNLVRARLIN